MPRALLRPPVASFFAKVFPVISNALPTITKILTPIANAFALVPANVLFESTPFLPQLANLLLIASFFLQGANATVQAFESLFLDPVIATITNGLSTVPTVLPPVSHVFDPVTNHSTAKFLFFTRDRVLGKDRNGKHKCKATSQETGTATKPVRMKHESLHNL